MSLLISFTSLIFIYYLRKDFYNVNQLKITLDIIFKLLIIKINNIFKLLIIKINNLTLYDNYDGIIILFLHYPYV